MERLALTGLAICALAGPVRSGPPDPVRPLPVIDHIVVDKKSRTLSTFSRGRHVRTFLGIQLGGQPVGHKRFQGDERTPEGRYYIDFGNSSSAYHLSLHISYPNQADVAYAEFMGRHPGGAIFIHGQPNGFSRGIRGDWTDGCIALSNEGIEFLWQTVPDGTVVNILP